MSVSQGSGALIGYGDIYSRNVANGTAPSVDIIAAAIATKTIKVANESWHRQYDQFLSVFA